MTIPQKQLDKALKDHALWRESNGRQGSRAVFRGSDIFIVDLKDADLRGTNLAYASLVPTNLKGANLEGANLSGAYLRTWKGTPLVLGNVLVTKCGGPSNSIEEWIDITDKNRNLIEALYL